MARGESHPSRAGIRDSPVWIRRPDQGSLTNELHAYLPIRCFSHERQWHTRLIRKTPSHLYLIDYFIINNCIPKPPKKCHPSIIPSMRLTKMSQFLSVIFTRAVSWRNARGTKKVPGYFLDCDIIYRFLYNFNIRLTSDPNPELHWAAPPPLPPPPAKGYIDPS